MLIPHLHFDGNCREAIDLYEKAFNTKADAGSFDYSFDGKRISHAVMKIHGAEVFLNDALRYLNDTVGNISCSAHLIVTFKTVGELLACYEILKADGSPYPFEETSYSKLCGNFMDKFGVLWGFIADK